MFVWEMEGKYFFQLEGTRKNILSTKFEGFKGGDP